MRRLRWLSESFLGKRQKHTNIAIAALIYFPVMLIAWFNYQQTSHYLTETPISRRQSTVHLTAIALNERFDRLTELGVSITMRPRFKGLVQNQKWDEAMDAIKQITESSPYIIRVILADPSGILRADFPRAPEMLGADLSYRDWYQGLKKDWNPHISEIFRRGAKPQMNVFTASMPIKSDDGIVRGILVLQVPVDTLLDWNKNKDLSHSDNTYFIDQHGHVTLTFGSGEQEIKTIQETPLAFSALEDHSGVEIDADPLTHQEMLIGYEKVSKYQWTVISQQPAKEAFALRDKTLNNLLLLYGFIGFLGFVLVFFIGKIQSSKAQLLKSEDRLQYALKNAHLGYWDLDLSTGKVIRSNQHDTLFGHSKNIEEWTNETFFRYVHPLDLEEVQKSFKKAIQRPQESHLECRIVWDDGSVHWIWIRSMVELDAEGKPIRLSGMVGDITERKNLELELIKARDEALSGARAKSSFLAVMSHEIRTPMNGILGFTQLLKQSPLSSEQKEYVGIIDQCGKGLLTLIDDILDYSKIDSGGVKLESKTISFPHMAEEITNLFSLEAKNKNLAFKFDLDPHLPDSFIGDPDRIRQILLNLIGNALKFTSKGSITVDIRPVTDSKNNFIEFSVIDTGIGIRADQQDKLFKPFSQIDGSATRAYGGTGLGLSICRSLIEKMNGKIFVQSTPGRGSTFRFQLPIETHSPLAVSIPSENSPKESSNTPDTSLRILVVEDNLVNRRISQIFLQQMGYDPDLAEDAFIALQMIQSKTYDLILLDIQMPGMDGIELCRRIRFEEKHKNMAIIAVSAGVLEEEKKKALAAGMDEFVMKPIDTNALRAAIDRSLSRLKSRDTTPNV
ncbi:MAG: ATP-binding protein [Verrucomicrobiota bacterium]